MTSASLRRTLGPNGPTVQLRRDTRERRTRPRSRNVQSTWASPATADSQQDSHLARALRLGKIFRSWISNIINADDCIVHAGTTKAVVEQGSNNASMVKSVLKWTAQPRQRAWAPKGRTGCKQCKLRHVKCSETRPRCAACLRRNELCQYEAPKARVFQPGGAAQENKSTSAAQLPLVWQVQTVSGTAEERQALQFYFDRAGQWFCGYGPFEGLALWSGAIPRTSSSLPALQHLLTAIALLEAPIYDATDTKILARSQSAMKHYTMGVNKLRQPGLTSAETALGPIMSWLIETLSFDEQRARMHLKGAQALHRRAIEAKPSLSRHSPDDFVHDAKHDGMLLYMYQFHCLRAKVAPHTSKSSPDNMIGSLTLINQDVTPTTSAKVRAAFIHYFTHLHPPDSAASSMPASKVNAAQSFIMKWERIILQNKYRTIESSLIFNALHLLCNLAQILLPVPVLIKPEPDEPEEDPIELGLQYIVQRCRWMLGLKLEEAADQSSLVDTVKLILEKLLTHAPQEHLAMPGLKDRAETALVLARQQTQCSQGPPTSANEAH